MNLHQLVPDQPFDSGKCQEYSMDLNSMDTGGLSCCKMCRSRTSGGTSESRKPGKTSHYGYVSFAKIMTRTTIFHVNLKLAMLLLVCLQFSLASADVNPNSNRIGKPKFRDRTKDKILHIGGIFPMTGSWAGGKGCRPAIEMALEDINMKPDILPGYTLKMVANDSQVSASAGVVHPQSYLPDKLYLFRIRHIT